MPHTLRTRLVESMQVLVIGLARPYILREFPGWGYVYRWAVGEPIPSPRSSGAWMGSARP